MQVIEKGPSGEEQPLEPRTLPADQRRQRLGFLMRFAATQGVGRLHLLRLLQRICLSHFVLVRLSLEPASGSLPVNAESPDQLAHFFRAVLWRLLGVSHWFRPSGR